MEVDLIVPLGTDVSLIVIEYPDLCEDEGWGDEGEQRYWNGHSSEEDDSDFEWMDYETCVEFCGFCEGRLQKRTRLSKAMAVGRRT